SARDQAAMQARVDRLLNSIDARVRAQKLADDLAAEQEAQKKRIAAADLRVAKNFPQSETLRIAQEQAQAAARAKEQAMKDYYAMLERMRQGGPGKDGFEGGAPGAGPSVSLTPKEIRLLRALNSTKSVDFNDPLKFVLAFYSEWTDGAISIVEPDDE